MNDRHGDGSVKLRFVVGAVIGWIAFALGWWRAFSLSEQPVSAWTLVLLGAFTIAVVLVTGSWVLHNKAIYRRKGPRKAIPVVRHEYTEDRLGRPIRYEPSTVSGAREIVLRITPDGAKVYERVDP